MDERIRDPLAIKRLDPQEVIEEFRGLVGSIVNALAKKLHISVDFEDLEGYAFQGLLEAHERFEPDDTASFSSYAYYRIRGAVLDGCRKEGWLTRDRSRNGDRLRSINEYMSSVAATRSAIPSARTLTEAVGRTASVVADAATIFLLHDAEFGEVGATAPANQHSRLEQYALTELLKKAFGLLDDDEREVVIRFHLEGEKMGDIAADIGHSTSWVSRINSRAIEKMRRYIVRHQ